MSATVRQSLGLILILVFAGVAIDYFGDVVWPAYLSMVGFYLIIFLVAVTSGQRKKNDHLLAHKSLPLWMAVFTMSATWVGGGFINGTAEYTYTSGLVWVQAPWGYALSLIVGGLCFAGPMRRRGYTTMLDPLEEKFGRRLNLLFYIPALLGDVFWSAAILVALGSTFSLIMGIDASVAIVLSAMVVIFYTSIGGLWSVAATDVIQMVVLMLGLGLVILVIFSGDRSMTETWSTYRVHMGGEGSLFPTREVLGHSWALWWDSALLLVLGGIPWQVYFQRVLAAKTVRVAILLSIFSGVVCLLAAIPPVLIGMTAEITDWASLGLQGPESGAHTLPYVIQNLTSPTVAVVGLGAVAAAVMSSADSSILSAASLTAWNILTPKSDQPKIPRIVLMRKIIWIVGITTTLIALNVTSIYELWVLCSDFVYCLLFPALTTALFDPKANYRGAFFGFVLALVLRLGGGEAAFGLPTWLPYPTEDGIITIPFRTIAMLANLLAIIVISRVWPEDANRPSTYHIQKT